MRLFSLLATLGVSTALTMGLAATAQAQVGTYRPGQPFVASPVSTPDQCASQCAGDAACRGWNAVSVSETQLVCELNSRDANAISAPRSVSGDGVGVRKANSRLVRGYTSPTLRIGQPTAPARPARTAQRPPRTTVINRQAVPQRAQPQASSHRRVAHRPVPARPTAPAPRFRHSLEGSARIAPAPTPAQAQPQVPHLAPHSAPQHAPLPPQATRQLPPQRQMRAPALPSPQAMSAPLPGQGPIQAPIQAPTMAPQPAPSAPQSPFAKPAAPAQAPAPAPAPAMPTAPRASIPQAALTQDSLFGSLYDDVAIPAPADPAALADVDAPIATAVSVPVTPVTQGPLPKPPVQRAPLPTPNMSGLAGG